MIRFENVSKTFVSGGRTIEAVKNVNLEIEKGKIYGIIGFSGAGKSTLVRCINLLERPTSGKVYIDGVELTGLSTAELRKQRENIGMIFQQFNLFKSRTVYENGGFSTAKKPSYENRKRRENPPASGFSRLGGL